MGRKRSKVAKVRSEQAGRTLRRGQAPGSAIYVGAPRDSAVSVRAFAYGPDVLEEREAASVGDLTLLRQRAAVTWLDLDGVHDVALVTAVCEALRIHPLVMEDILNPEARAKVEAYDGFVFAIAKMVSPATEEGGRSTLEQVAIVMGTDWVVTFQERPGDLFESLRRRVRQGSSRLRSAGPDLLLHGVLDCIVDGYFEVIEQLDDAATALDERALAGDGEDLARDVHAVKNELRQFRRAVWPMREATLELIRAEGSAVTPTTVPFLRDLSDHVQQVVEGMDSLRDRLTSVVELHLAITSNQMNEVMRVLTLVSTIFIPLTFVAGVYGMNFHHMPELNWTFGYPGVLGVMLATTLGMLAWLRGRGWL